MKNKKTIGLAWWSLGGVESFRFNFLNSRNRIRILVLIALFWGLINQPAEASESSNISISRINDPVVFDGIADAGIWETVTPFKMFVHAPNFGHPPTEQSDVRIGFDDEYLWVFAHLYYSDVTNIVSTSKKRDEESKNSDSFGIILDTYNDNESALAFFTTPAGQRIDYAISNDASSQSSGFSTGPMNYSWNSFWDVKTESIENGWTVEMRIPFSSLRFQDENGVVKMGVILNRTISYCNEINTYPEIDPKYGMYAPMKPSQAITMELTGIKPNKPTYITPYILSGVEQNQILNASGNKYNSETDPQLTGGLDVKYSLNSNLTLDLTVNTDFAQVEADDEQVNITRYSMYFAEKRMFFQERSSIFGFNLGNSQELFYSRRIGLSEGQPVRIYGGARLTGRVGKWDLGLLDMQTQQFNANPSENFGVFRVRRQVINPNSYVGAIATSRIGINGSNSTAYGLEGLFRLFGDDYLETRLAQTSNQAGQLQFNSKENSFAYLKCERRNEKGFAYDLSYTYSGLNFNPSIGFMSKLGIEGVSIQTQYGWLPGEKSRLFSFKYLLSYLNTKRLLDGGLESSYLSSGFSFITKQGWSLFSSLFSMKEGIVHEFRIAKNASIPMGQYQYLSGFSMLSTPYSKPLVMSLTLSGGEYYDGKRFSITAKPTVNLSSDIQLSGSYSYNQISFSARNQSFNSHIGQFKFLYMYNTKLSLSSFIQYNSLSRMLIGNLRLRYNPKEGNDFYLVYNEIRPGSDYPFGEAEPIPFLSRMVLLKYAHTFKL